MLRERPDVSSITQPDDLSNLFSKETVSLVGGEHALAVSLLSLAMLPFGFSETQEEFAQDFAQGQITEGLRGENESASAIARGLVLFDALQEADLLLPHPDRRDRFVVEPVFQLQLDTIVAGLQNGQPGLSPEDERALAQAFKPTNFHI